MPHAATPPLAWVESPLQLIGAAEWAAAHGTRVIVAGRLTAQMSQTADELVTRGAPFGELHPYVGIPFALLFRHRHWLVGDGFSGQFRLAASLLRPRQLTFLDDGANAVAFAETLIGDRPFARPGVDERALTRAFAPFAHDLVHRRALAARVSLFTAFPVDGDRRERLDELGVRTVPHDFAWTRGSARPVDLGEGRVLLGSARPVDGALPLDTYLAWVASEAAAGPLAYLPHRRETAATIDAVRALAGVRVIETNLPVELVLAGSRHPLEVLTLASSTLTTLPLVLEGSGSVLRARDPYPAPRSRARLNERGATR